MYREGGIKLKCMRTRQAFQIIETIQTFQTFQTLQTLETPETLQTLETVKTPSTLMRFELTDHEYIQLNQLLKLLGLVETGGEANQRIVNGEVQVNNKVEYQKRKKLRKGDVVKFGKAEIEIN